MERKELRKAAGAAGGEGDHMEKGLGPEKAVGMAFRMGGEEEATGEQPSSLKEAP